MKFIWMQKGFLFLLAMLIVINLTATTVGRKIIRALEIIRVEKLIPNAIL